MDNTQPSWQLLAKYLANETTEAEDHQISEWLLTNKRNKEILNQARRAWNKPLPAPREVDTGKAWASVMSAIEPPAKASFASNGITVPAARERSIFQYGWMKIAASVALLVTLVYVVYLLAMPKVEVEMAEAYNPAGRQSRITLPDGTQIRLLAESRLRYPKRFTGNTREVELTGEAFFTVARNTARPFIVHTAGLTTTVLGTSFHVQARPEANRSLVAVATGKVRVARESGDTPGVVLQPNEAAVYTPATRELSKHTANPEQVLAWQTGELYFNDESLENVAAALERWYGVQISFTDEAIKSCLLTARFRNETLQNVLESIRLSVNIQFRMEQKKVALSGKGC